MPVTTRRTFTYEREMARVGARFKQARTRQELTQEDVVGRLGRDFPRSFQWLSDIELGKQALDMITGQRIADVLAYPIAYFSDRRYDERRPQWPRTLNEWILLAAGDTDLAGVHWQLDLNVADQRKEPAAPPV